jgi:putative two-component system response regulator
VPPESLHRVVIVDDETCVRDVLGHWLAGQGYECLPAANADEALGLLSAGNVSLLISDITMPGKSGLELLARTRQEFPDVAVLIVTGIDDRQTAIRALQLGAYGYVIKPFDLNEILINVANALERRRLFLASRAHEQRLEQEVNNRTTELRRREEQIVLHLMSAAELRDEETGGHIRRIGAYSAVLARRIGWQAPAVDSIRVAALMHDVGKIGVPDRLLRKPGKLTTEEFEAMKVHTRYGARILANADVPLLQLAGEIALSHHENWDGSGYPRALAGAAIPPSGRVVAIADVYDALVHDRIYRRALPEREALAVMAADSGRRFDPRMFASFLEALPELRAIREDIREEAGTSLRLEPVPEEDGAPPLVAAAGIAG